MIAYLIIGEVYLLIVLRCGFTLPPHLLKTGYTKQVIAYSIACCVFVIVWPVFLIPLVQGLVKRSHG